MTILTINVKLIGKVTDLFSNLKFHFPIKIINPNTIS